MNEDIGIYAEARRRALHYANQNETLKKKILGIGPAPNGARAETINPFDRPARLPIQSKLPFWRLHGESRLRKRMQRGELRDDLDVNPLQIVQAVSFLSHLPASTLLGFCRERRVVFPRQVVIYFIARYCGELSLTQIAYIFGMHHTTVMHAIKVVPARIDAGHAPTRAMVEEIESMLRAIPGTATHADIVK